MQLAGKYLQHHKQYIVEELWRKRVQNTKADRMCADCPTAWRAEEQRTLHPDRAYAQATTMRGRRRKGRRRRRNKL
jgi:hypothetical protein